jgi:hypothetical protein
LELGKLRVTTGMGETTEDERCLLAICLLKFMKAGFRTELGIFLHFLRLQAENTRLFGFGLRAFQGCQDRRPDSC